MESKCRWTISVQWSSGVLAARAEGRQTPFPAGSCLGDHVPPQVIPTLRPLK